jgi:hypothetical protein
MKRLIPLLIICFLSLESFSQDQIDALRYSQTYAGGTARTVAMAGAFGSLGGDFYSVSQNPAGLGVYRRSELTFTPEVYNSSVNARYNGNEREDYRSHLGFSNFGYVAAFEGKGSGITGGSVAFGYNKINNFNSNIHINGPNTHTSLADMFVASANYGEGYGPVDPAYLLPFTEDLFYQGYIMDLGQDGYYYINNDIRDTTGSINIQQDNTLQRSGKMNEWVFSTGLNFEHKLYLGATFSVVATEYNEKSIFRENDGVNTGTQYFRYEETLNVTGTGYSGKFGLIYRPLAPLRVGLAYHLPTSYYMKEVYDANIQTLYVNGTIFPTDEYDDPIDYARYEYRIITPGKAVGSLGLMVGKIMILNTDVEYINYAAMRFKRGSDGYDFSTENQTIKDIYRDNINVKTGIEVRLDKLYLRGGYGYYGSPYKKSEINADAYTLNYSGGIGYRSENFFIDLAVSYFDKEEQMILYTSNYASNAATTALEEDIVRVMFTVGFRF